MSDVLRNQVRDILLEHGFRRDQFDEAFWPDRVVEQFMQDPHAGIRWFSKQAATYRWELDEA